MDSFGLRQSGLQHSSDDLGKTVIPKDYLTTYPRHCKLPVLKATLNLILSWKRVLGYWGLYRDLGCGNDRSGFYFQ
jgi:hypothetical protein